MELLPVLVTKAKRPYFVVATQHGAPWSLGTAPFTACGIPFAPTRYDVAEPAPAAPPAALETTMASSRPKSNPNGVCPVELVAISEATEPSNFTLKELILFVAFSVTISQFPFGVKAICGATTPVPLSDLVDPSICANDPPDPTRNPWILSVPKFNT